MADYEGVTDDTVDEFVDELHNMKPGDFFLLHGEHIDNTPHQYEVSVTWTCKTCGKTTVQVVE